MSQSILLQHQWSHSSHYDRGLCCRSVVRDSNITSPPRMMKREASKKLIMGDSILGRINKKGHKNNVEVLHYPGVKIDTVCDKNKVV